MQGRAEGARAKRLEKVYSPSDSVLRSCMKHEESVVATVSVLVPDQQCSLTRAFLVMLTSQGLLIPGLDDAVGGQERHGPVPLSLPELLLLIGLRDGSRSLSALVAEVADQTACEPEHLRDVLAKLWDRNLLIHARAKICDPCSEQIIAVSAASVTVEPSAVLAITTPRFFRLSQGKFEHIDHEGRIRAQLSAVELAAVSEFRQPLTAQQALDEHHRSCGLLALDESGFNTLVHRLGAAELLQRTDSQDLEVRSWLQGRLAISREGFKALNGLMRERVGEYEVSECKHEGRSGLKRVKVVSVQENGTIFPLALGMIVAYSKAYDGGRLNEHYAFHPDWLVRPSKVRALTQEPGIFLFSNYNWSHRHNLLVSRKVKQMSPWSVTIHGGPNTPKYEADCEAYFHANPDVDITVRGEGEVAVAELLTALVDVVGKGPLDFSVLRDITGISFRDGDAIVHTPERARIADLDSIPSPILTGLFLAYKGTPLGIIESNRGCPYSCTFCDWGSAISSRIRQFSLDRVFAELEWCAKHQVDGVMCADANFGIFERDVLIAEKVAALKKESGYPNSFSTNFAKNTTKHLKRIIEILTDVGVVTTGTIAVQSMDPGTLKTIKRSNIRLDQYDALATEFHKARLPLIMDLMFGLPGQTFMTFQNDLQECINRGVFPRMYMAELLVNSPMNEPSYREEHRIRAEPSPDGSRQFVVSTATFSRQEYEEMNGLRRLFVLGEVFGMLREVARFVRSETGVREIDFYERLRCDLRDDPERWPMLAFSVRALPAFLVSPAGWQVVIAEIKSYLIHVLSIEEDDAMTVVLAVQLAVLPSANRLKTPMVKLAHDYSSWHKAVVNAKEAGHHDDWPSFVPRLRDVGPASFSSAEHAQIGSFGLNPALFGVQYPTLTY